MNTMILMVAMAVAAAFGALGQLAMKNASTAQLSVGGIVLNPWLWAFAVCYGVGVVINFFAYRAGGNVAVIYPMISLSYVFSALLAWKFLGEVPSRWTVLGICVIMLGVGIIGWGVHNG